MAQKTHPLMTRHPQPGIRAGLAQKRASPSILRYASLAVRDQYAG